MPPDGTSSTGFTAGASNKSTPDLRAGVWADFNLWARTNLSAARLTLAVTLLTVATIITVYFIQSYNTLQIDPMTVPESLASQGFDGTTAAKYLWYDVEQIENQALDAPNNWHPALAETDALHADMQSISIPATGISLAVLLDTLRDFFPGLRPTEVTGSFVEYGNKLTLEIAIDDMPVYIGEASTTPENAVETAKAILFQAERDNDAAAVKVFKVYDSGTRVTPAVTAKTAVQAEPENGAAFAVVQKLHPYVAIAALNGWGKPDVAIQDLHELINGPDQSAATMARAYNLLGFIEIEKSGSVQANAEAGTVDHLANALTYLGEAGSLPISGANLCYIYQDTTYSKYNLGEAISQCRYVAHQHPDLDSPHLHLGVLYKLRADTTLQGHSVSPSDRQQSAMDFHNAEVQFREALRINANSASAYSGLGDLRSDPLNAKPDYACSISQYDTSLYINPNYTIAELGRADAYTGEGDWIDADRDYHSALDIDGSLEPLEKYVHWIDRLAATSNNPLRTKTYIGNAKMALGRKLAQVSTTTDRTLANIISTEIEILGADQKAAGSNSADCLSDQTVAEESVLNSPAWIPR